MELHRSACIHKSAVSKIFEIKKIDLQKWIFRYSNFMNSTDPLFFFLNYRYIFVTEKINYIINLFLKWGSSCTNSYSLSWLQRCVTWYRYYSISLGPDRSQFWKCCTNSAVVIGRDFLGFEKWLRINKYW